MTALYAFGNNPGYYFSQSGISVSVTGNTNDFVGLTHTPFQVHSACVGAAYNPVADTWIAVSNKGEIAYSDNLTEPWSTYYLSNKFVNIRRIIANQGRYVLVGAIKDPVSLSEKAVIFTTALGGNANQWYQAYTNTNSHSMILDITVVPSSSNLPSTLIASGYNNGGLLPLLLISTDNGLNWSQVELDPNIIKGTIYSVAVAGDPLNATQAGSVKLYLGGTSSISVVDFSTNHLYLLSDQFFINGKSKPIYRIVANNSLGLSGITTQSLIALQSNNIYFSNNLFDWHSVQTPGYTLISAVWTDLQDAGTWYFGVESMLNQYTGFTMSAPAGLPLPTNPQLVGYNNQIQAQEFVTA